MIKKYLISLIIILSLFNCTVNTPPEKEDINYRNEMRQFVQKISNYGKNKSANFIIIPQNGHDLLTLNGESSGPIATQYINAIDGVGREDLFYGYDQDDMTTDVNIRDEMIAFLDIAESNNVEVLVTDYCSTVNKIDNSYTQNYNKNYISFAADSRELDKIPDYAPVTFNNNNITALNEAQNFLYLINPDNYNSKEDFLNDMALNNYDLLIIDLFYDGTEQLTSTDLSSLKTKQNGAARLVIAYMSIGEAEDYRFYWRPEWHKRHPDWLYSENPDWPGNYKVSYWNSQWQNIILGNNDAYLDKIIDSGFDGVYLDIIDAFEYFEGSD